MASLNDAQKVVRSGKAEGWGKLVQFPENKRKEGLGFSASRSGMFNPTEGTFHSAKKELLTVIQTGRHSRVHQRTSRD